MQDEAKKMRRLIAIMVAFILGMQAVFVIAGAIHPHGDWWAALGILAISVIVKARKWVLTRT